MKYSQGWEGSEANTGHYVRSPILKFWLLFNLATNLTLLVIASLIEQFHHPSSSSNASCTKFTALLG